ncbi:hypothetical protein [Hyphomicrobium sp. D-2]|uniref:hypothetical protein n=1 Tax=Hyphomicrobium sp. D-2 TaxID=3041621 RepID=UPI002455A196|nr:hypothetical protein [Hyphomicrobium sp. D-2]MDH4982612.1 hypothetical protein [Hyphomicrobium sp. D-2]
MGENVNVIYSAVSTSSHRFQMMTVAIEVFPFQFSDFAPGLLVMKRLAWRLFREFCGCVIGAPEAIQIALPDQLGQFGGVVLLPVYPALQDT